jgi:catechol-2,3-dioxygenase
MSIPVTRLNHAVLYVRDVERSIAFYREAFGFEVVQQMGNRAGFLRSPLASNHHDLGLFAVGERAPSPPQGATGLYHLAWEVPTLGDLAAAQVQLANMGALVGQSDHGVSKSLYAKDPDGNEFEIMWAVPREHWGEAEATPTIGQLDLERDLARFA